MVMRVVGGVAKGRRMRGSTIPGARPTSELVRGAIFNVLGPLDLGSVRVLDLYAGSGSLGIEALSRGAFWADFVERHPRQCAAIRENLAATGFTDRARVFRLDVNAALATLKDRYGLVLMDPPYRLTSLGDVLDRLAGSEIVESGATVVVGHSKRLSLQSSFRELHHVRSYRYGDSALDFFEEGGP